MSMKLVIKSLVLATSFGVLAACNSIVPNFQDQSYSEAKNLPFEEAMEHEQWVRDEFAKYKSRRGNKAFAVSISNNYVIASGWGDDKTTMQWAEQEAMRMCGFYSEGQGQCVIVDKSDGPSGHGLTSEQINSAPKVLIAHRDIRHYQNYLKADAPKAFIVAACSGQAFWEADADSKHDAEHEAMESCENGRHPSDPCCTVLESE